jgi:hypothetical protein
VRAAAATIELTKHDGVRRVIDDSGVTAADLRVPGSMRDRAQSIIDISDTACREHLDEKYAQLTRKLVARLARKQPSPLARGDVRIWAAGAIYCVGQINFLFDRRSSPHMTGDELAQVLGVVKTTMAAKAARINRILGLRAFEPELTRADVLDQHPLAWLGHVAEIVFAGRALPCEFRDGARRRGLISDVDEQSAA